MQKFSHSPTFISKSVQNLENPQSPSREDTDIEVSKEQSIGEDSHTDNGEDTTLFSPDNTKPRIAENTRAYRSYANAHSSAIKNIYRNS